MTADEQAQIDAAVNLWLTAARREAFALARLISIVIEIKTEGDFDAGEQRLHDDAS